MKRLAAAVAAGAVSACAAQGGPTIPPAPSEPPPGDHRFDVSFDGADRAYIVHVPPTANRPLPVLLAFHGGGGNAGQFQSGAAFDRHADANGYAVVYPDGTGALGFHVWNAGGCCGSAPEDGIDDVGFTRAVVDDLAARLPIDRDRVYATGHSNGSMIAHRLGAEATDLVAAIAPYAGAPYFDILGFAPDRTLPVLHIHSVDDPRALYEGGLGPPFPITGVRTDHNPVEEQLDRWVEHNRCGPTPVEGPTVQGEAGTVGEGHTATLVRWTGCDDGVEVGLLRLTGAGHGWPGEMLTPAREAIVGPETNVIDIEEEIWNFVSVYRR